MNAVPPPDVQALVKELAAQVLGHAAPEELALFAEMSQEYFENPQRVLQARGRDEAVGFGLDVAMLTPYVLAVAGSVVSFLLATLADSIKDELKPRVATLVRALFRGKSTGTAIPLTQEQARQVHAIAYQRAISLGL